MILELLSPEPNADARPYFAEARSHDRRVHDRHRKGRDQNLILMEHFFWYGGYITTMMTFAASYTNYITEEVEVQH